MSKKETPLTRAYWEKVGGTLLEEFMIVKGGRNRGKRLVDGIIIVGGPKEILAQDKVNLEGKEIICIQTKASRLGMNLMGQALFSRRLLEEYHKPGKVRSIAICTQTDEILEPMLEEMGIEVVLINEMTAKTTTKREKNS